MSSQNTPATGYQVVDRLMELSRTLQAGPCTRKEIAERMFAWYHDDESGARALRRDLACLKTMGYRIGEDKRERTCWLETSSVNLSLTDEDVKALAIIRECFKASVPHSRQVQAVLAKVEEALPENKRKLFRRKPALTILLQAGSDYQRLEVLIKRLEKAIRERHQICFEYRPLDRERIIKHPIVDPYEFQYFDGHLYLIGYSHKMNNIFEYRLDFIVGKVEILPSLLVESRARRTIPFQYRLTRKIALRGVSERFLDSHVQYQLNEDAIVTAKGYTAFRIIQEILRYGEQAEILNPPELRAKAKSVVEQMAALYAEDGADR